MRKQKTKTGILRSCFPCTDVENCGVQQTKITSFKREPHSDEAATVFKRIEPSVCVPPFIRSSQ